MGTGKSSVGRLAAAQLHFRFVDTDEQIERGAGKSISRIFAEEGEPAFRALEAQVGVGVVLASAVVAIAAN